MKTRDHIASEIVLVAEGLRALFVATIGLLLAFNQIGWTKEQLGAVMLEYQAISTFLASIVRGAVTPNGKVPDPTAGGG